AWVVCRGAAPTGIYPLPLHDALPIFPHGGDLERKARGHRPSGCEGVDEVDAHEPGARGEPAVLQLLGRLDQGPAAAAAEIEPGRDRKSTRLNSSHVKISYAVFCLKKK